jgi:hypothetical protein
MKKETWILVLGIYFAGHDETHAIGPFSSERNCVRRRAMIGISMQEQWLGVCFTQAEFLRLYPSLTLDVET